MDPVLSKAYGFTDEDLENIDCVVILGDQFHYYTNYMETTDYWPEASDWATRVNNEQGTAYWYSKEDGSEIETGHWEDLSFLKQMKNLRCIHLAKAEIGNLPELAALDKIERIKIEDCTVPDLNWTAGGSMIHFAMTGIQDGLDYTPLNTCGRLSYLDLSFGDTREADLSGLAPESLFELNVNSGDYLRECRLDGLRACGNLENLMLSHLPLRSLDFLEKANGIKRLNMSGLQISDLRPVTNCKSLWELQLDNCQNLYDLSPLAECTEMVNIMIGGWREQTDVSFLNTMTKLKSVELHSVDIPNVDFVRSMKTVGTPIGITIKGRVGDWSALESANRYEQLFLNPWDGEDFGRIAPHLEGAKVNHMKLTNFETLDLSTLPAVFQSLELERCSGLTDLTGLPTLKPAVKLVLTDLENLESLNGLKEARNKVKTQIRIAGCPRLTDWSAVEGTNLTALELVGTYMMPDMSGMRIQTLRLESLHWLENLDFLDTISPEHRFTSLQLFDLPLVTDLSPVRQAQGGVLSVPPEMKEMAASIVEEGRFRELKIEYPEAGWQPWDTQVRLKSLEEIDRLPLAALREVTELTLAGDTVVDFEKYDVWSRSDWHDGERESWNILWDNENQQEIRVEKGSLTDLNRLKPLTGLKSLQVYEQPLTSLAGLEEMAALEGIKIENCPELADITSLFMLENVRDISIETAAVESIQGIQNLASLRRLYLHFTNVRDISPLAECDLTEAYSENGLTLDIKGYDNIDPTPLEAIRKFDYVPLNGGDVQVWLPHMRGAEVDRLCIDNVEQEEIKDLTMLEGMKIRRLRIDSIKYLASLHGIEGLLKDNGAPGSVLQQIGDLIAWAADAALRGEAREMPEIRSGDGILEELEILGCPRLTDWSALDGARLEKLWLYGAYTVPDLSRTDLGTLRLEQMDWMEDLSDLETLPEEQEISVELSQMDRLRNLDGLARLKNGQTLAVPEELLDMAEALVKGGSFRNAEIADADGWGLNDREFSLASWEELETLPDSVLACVDEIFLAGDTLYDRGQYDVQEDWEWDGNDNRRVLYLHHFETDTRTRIEPGTMTDLTKLGRLTGLTELNIVCQPLTSLAGIEGMTKLENLYLEDMPLLTDVSPAFGLQSLRGIHLRDTGVRNVEGIEKLPKLKDISLWDSLENIRFLKETDFTSAYEDGGVNLYLNAEPEADASPLESVREFDHLQVDGDKTGNWLPHLRNAKVKYLTVNGWNGELTADMLPPVSERLEMHNLPGLKDFTGLKGPGPRFIQLDDLPNLVSLNGLRDLINEDGIREMELGGLPKLSDWSALEGTNLQRLGVFGDMVFLPDSLAKQAETVEDGWWKQDVRFSVDSLEQLLSLPDSLLEKIDSLMIVGDRVVNMEDYDLTRYWDGEKGKEIPCLVDGRTGEETPAEAGEGIDLGFLSRMTGLRTLYLYLQPITDLKAVSSLTRLQILGLDFCAELRDLAGIGELRDLECLGLNGTAVQSLEGIQSLNRLREIDLNNTPVTDLSALGECDFSFAAENGGVKIWIPNNFEIRDWSFLERIPKFEWLSLGGIDPELWTEHVQGAQVIGFFGRFDTQKQMKTFLEAHPEIEVFEIPWCNSITDLSMLPGMPNLRYVHISDTMNQAVLSLEGTEYGFELWVEESK